MPLIKDQAVVLRRLDYSESSQVLAVFTREHGKVRVIAKGSRKSTKTRFSAGLDLLDVVDVVLSVRSVGQENLALLTEWHPGRPHLGLRDRLDRLYGAQYAAAITTELTEDWDPHPSLFDAFGVLLDALDEATDSISPVVAFQQALLVQVGMTPLLEECIGCGRSISVHAAVHFSALEGGVLCRDCEPAYIEKREVSADVLGSLVYGVARYQPAAFELLDYHLAHAAGRENRAARAFLLAATQQRT